MKVLDELSEKYFIHKRPTIKKSDNLEHGWGGTSLQILSAAACVPSPVETVFSDAVPDASGALDALIASAHPDGDSVHRYA